MPKKIETEIVNSEMVLTNQTQFSHDEPLFEEPPVFFDEKVIVTQPKSKKSIVPFLALGVMGVFVLVLGVLILFKSQHMTITQKPIIVQSNANQQQTDALNTHLNEIQSDFQNADPSQPILPFPPVDMNIYLDQPKQ